MFVLVTPAGIARTTCPSAVTKNRVRPWFRHTWEPEAALLDSIEYSHLSGRSERHSQALCLLRHAKSCRRNHRRIQVNHSSPYFWETYADHLIFRGIGLAVTRSLLKEHNARVVTISRTRTPELSQLIQEHEQSLLTLECNM
jgi:hypothetical protein